MADPQALSLGERVNALQGAHPWMDAPVVATLAASTTTPQAAVEQGNTMQDSLQTTWQSVAGAWDDPVLYNHDGADVALRAYLSNSMGPPPIAQADLNVTLKNLQAKGFGVGLTADGTWDAAKQQALHDYTQAAISDAYAGNRPLAQNAHHAAHSLLSSIMPGNLLHTVIGYAKALPRQVANLGADVIGGAAEIGGIATVGVGQALAGNGTEGIKQAQRFGAQVGTDVNTVLGGKQMSAQEFYNRQTSAAQVVNDIGTIMTITPGGVGEAAVSKFAAGAQGAARTGLVKGLTDVGSEASLAAAQRGPGLIVRTLAKPTFSGRALRGAVLGAGVGAGTAAIRGDSITQGAEYGALGGVALNGVLGSGLAKTLGEKYGPNWVANHPLSARTAPLVGKLADADGLYYRARTMLAQPYRVPLVRGLGNAYAETIPYGLFAAGQSALAGHFDPNNPLTQSINNDTTLDPLDHRLQALSSGLTGGHFAIGLNDLAWVLHGDIPLLGEKGRTSTAIGHGVDAANDHINDMLGQVGALGAIERANQAVYGKGWSAQRQIDTTFGGDASAFNKFWTDKIDQLAVARYAEKAVHDWVSDNGGVAPSWDEKQQIERSAAHEIWNDDNILSEHRNYLLSSGNPLATGELETRLRAQIVGNLQEPEMAGHGASAYVRAVRIASGLVKDPEAMKSLVTPDTWAALAAHRAEAAEAGVTTRPVATRSFIGANGLPEAGAIGLAVKGKLGQPQALKKIAQYEQQLTDAESTEERARIAADAHYWLSSQGNFDPNTLGVFRFEPMANGSIPLIDRMREYAQTLGSPVGLAVDAPREVRQAVAALEAQGYQLWHGTDIGHAIRIDRNPELFSESQSISRGRKIATAFGLNPEHFRSLDVAAYKRDRLRNNLQKLVTSGRLQMPAYYTPDRLITDLRTNANAQAQLGSLPGSIFEATGKFRQSLIEAQANATGKTPAEVIEQMKNELAQYHALRDIPRDVVHQVLGRTDNIPEATDLAREVAGENHLPLFTPDQIDLIHQTIINSNRAPGYMVGMGRLDDLLRAGLGLGGHDWGGPIGQAAARVGDRVALLGNNYGRIRDNFRFTMSPAFSARRVTKTRIKLDLEGIPSTATPVKDMLEGTTYAPRVPAAVSDTKVTGADGSPLLVYHGTQADFGEFRDDLHGDKGWYGPGHYFTVDPRYAKTYAGKQGNLKRAYLNITNPLKWDSNLSKADAMAFLKTVGRDTDPWALSRVRAATEDFTKDVNLETLTHAIVHHWPDFPVPWEQSIAKVQAKYDARVSKYMKDKSYTAPINPEEYKYNPVSQVRFNRAVRDFATNKGHDGIEHYEKVPGPEGNVKIPEQGIRSFVAFKANQIHDAVPQPQNDVYEAAHRYYASLFPEHADPAADEFDRALHAADIFAIYQPRQYAAHAAWQAKQMGWSDEKTKAALTRAFEYGNKRYGEGRTAAERTANTIFFPFSFEKTVLRNVGGYLMDHPAQLMALNGGLAAYQQFSQTHPDDPLSGPYLQSHVPLLHEILRLNPFAHGLSPGELGGINAPLLNVFLPQSWDQSNPNSLGLLGRLAPALNDINRTWKEAGQQTTIVESALQNVYDYAENQRNGTPAFFRYKPVITDIAQQKAAQRDRVALVEKLQPVLDANRHLGPGQQYRFSSDPSVDPALRGEVVTKSAIDQLLHEIYPAYDPAGAAKYSQEITTNSTTYLDSIKDRPQYVPYAQFAEAVKSFQGHAQNGDYRDYPQQQAQITSTLRQFALAATMTGNNGKPDRGFYNWYNKTFAKALGPLTGVS